MVKVVLNKDGSLQRTCRFRGPDLDSATDAELVELLRFAVRHKELKHRINEPGFRRPPRSMSQIGG